MGFDYSWLEVRTEILKRLDAKSSENFAEDSINEILCVLARYQENASR